MKPKEVYQKLADHLNEHTTLGLPKTPSLFRILEVVFPAEEAEIALRLPMQHTKLSVLKDLYPEVSDLEEILESMIGNGTVSCYEQPGHEKTYCLLSAFGGWLETPFWGGRIQSWRAKWRLWPGSIWEPGNSVMKYPAGLPW